MKVEELIRELEKVPATAHVFMGYDGNIVVTRAKSVELMCEENQIGPVWFEIKVGDVVILCER